MKFMKQAESRQFEKKEISRDDLKLNTPDGFNKRFEHYLKTSDTQSDAYMKAEQDHASLFGTEMYSSYDSFRVCRNRKMKINK